MRKSCDAGTSRRKAGGTPEAEKREVVRQILACLTAEAENLARSARAAHTEATDEQSKAENKYDTRGLEASYLARGQSRQAAEISAAIAQYDALELREFSADEAISLGAIIEVESAGEQTRYFLGPSAGGTEIAHGGQPLLVITAQSPLGRLLIGRRAGETIPFGAAGGERCRIVSVR